MYVLLLHVVNDMCIIVTCTGLLHVYRVGVYVAVNPYATLLLNPVMIKPM